MVAGSKVVPGLIEREGGRWVADFNFGGFYKGIQKKGSTTVASRKELLNTCSMAGESQILSKGSIEQNGLWLQVLCFKWISDIPKKIGKRM
jgi:hypothetical protein